MDSYFDQIARTVAGSMTRRQALWRIGGILGGAALSALGLAGRALGGPTLAACNAYCGQFPVPALRNFLACRQTCLSCTSISQMCGASATHQTCCMVANGTAGCASNSCTTVGCNSGFTQCGSNCFNVATDINNCGGCGQVCNKGSQVATVGCSASTCVITSCNAGFVNCDNTFANGCEVNINTDVNNCGSCGHVCSGNNVAVNGCSAGSCTVVSCKPGFFNCNGSASDGCEVSINTDTNNCGSCGHVCSGANVAVNGCSAGACTIVSCNAGFANCDGAAANGCEANLATDINNCGSCGHVCAKGSQVATVGCSASSCVITSCNAGFANCDGAFSNGCEVNLTSDASNCGSCGHACASGHSCVGSVCQ